MGRPRKPSRLKALAGNPGRRPLRENEVQPRAVTPRMPAWLSSEAKRAWARIVPKLAALKLLTHLDCDMLAALCTAQGELEIATRALDADGRFLMVAVFDRSGKTQIGTKVIDHPAAARQSELIRLVNQLA